MIAVYPDSVMVEFYNGSAWTDVSAYVVGDINGQSGLGGWQPDRRVAMLGTLNVTLNNKAKLFSPMGGDVVRGLNTLAGFQRGAKIRVRIQYGGSYYTRWSGRIMTIDSDDKNWGAARVRLLAVDWMDVPSSFPMKRADIALNQRMDQAITLILARLSIQPEDTDIDTGTFTFPAVFDNVKNKTMAIGELNKLALSELGYIYVKGDGTLRAENSLARGAWRPLDTISLGVGVGGYLLKEDGFYLLKEDGGKIILDGTSAAAVALDADAESYNILLDRDALLNSITIRAYPTITDTSLKVLYSLGKPFYIADKGTVTFSAHYTDPNGLAQVAGTNMQTPVASTDYLSNTLEDGTGTDRTTDLQVTATYYGDTVEYSIYNDNSLGVWVTKLQARGYGIYYGNSIEYIQEDAASQASYGLSAIQIDQRYQKNAQSAEEFVRIALAEYAKPKSRLSKLGYLANLNENHMQSFLELDTGALIKAAEDRSGIENNYYVTDVGFSIKQGGIINVEYGLKQNDTLLSGGLVPLTVEFSGGSSSERINFRKHFHLENLTQKTIAFWLYPDTADGNSRHIFQMIGGGVGGGHQVEYHSAGGLAKVFVQVKLSGGYRSWASDTGLTLGQWNHVVVVRDETTPTDAPTIYFAGSPVSVTLSSPNTGTVLSNAGTELELGGPGGASHSVDGKLFDVRMYNRLLSAGEVTTLFNSGAPDVSLVTNGLLFQAFAGLADDGDGAARAGEVLDSLDVLLDNIHRITGTADGSPVLRANP